MVDSPPHGYEVAGGVHGGVQQERTGAGSGFRMGGGTIGDTAEPVNTRPIIE